MFRGLFVDDAAYNRFMDLRKKEQQRTGLKETRTQTLNKLMDAFESYSQTHTIKQKENIETAF